MNPIDFWGQRSKVKVTMDIYGNNLVNTIETKPLCAAWSNFADMLAYVPVTMIAEMGYRVWTSICYRYSPSDINSLQREVKTKTKEEVM